MYGLDNYKCGYSNYNFIQAGTWLCASHLLTALEYVSIHQNAFVHVHG